MEKDNSRTLQQLKSGHTAQIKDIRTDAKMAEKLAAMGLVRGQFITRKKGSSPVVVNVSGTEVAIGRETAKKIVVTSKKNTFLLAGNPNVGKSLIFSRLTGIGIISSNFPGTTVGLNYGQTQFDGEAYDIIDIPGLYRLEEEWVIEGKKRNLFKELDYDFIVCVADASHLERNLYFLLEILQLKKPVILLLNKFDQAQRKGIHIDIKALKKLLGIPVIATVGTTGEGLKELAHEAARLAQRQEVSTQLEVPPTPEGKWNEIGRIIRKVQTVKHKHPSFWEHLQGWATTPITGLPIALIVLVLSFMIIRWVGEGIINFVDPLYEAYYFPFMEKLFGSAQDGFLGKLLVGDGGETFFGILTDGLKIALVDVMAYVLAFYALMGFLGDLGYLPRLAVLLDGILHKVGLHGYGSLPIMLGFGCKVPAVMGVRVLETRRERVIALALILVLAPCISQTAMIISILSPYGIKYMLMVFGALVVNGILAGTVLNKLMKGETPELFMEIPSWQVPQWRPLLRKLWLRMKEYLCDALPLILVGVLFVDLMQFSGLTAWITKISRYPVEMLLGLPADTTPLLILGFLRKDISIALLEPFHLAPEMLVVACVFMAMYLPCVATFFVMLRESGWKDTLRVVSLTLGLAFLSAWVLRLILL
ncbi:MAG: ferrous iron transporter B [Elusimicrobium sp.]|uniref:Ferrous iron transporter B n=1 Tax=Candidatus Avelusimicrobium gallicola TaxID=2562704 RepID=A0A928HER2_9BACT|nr:ferrous iron transporter B [Elusimicrobium sp.]